MSIYILGKKIGMMQVFDNKNMCIPVTIIHTEPCFITQQKLIENDGYNSIQVGYSIITSKVKKKLNKAEIGHLQKHNLPALQTLREFKVENPLNYKIGQQFDLKNFNIGDLITINAKSIGKGTSGNIKRHNFNRGPMSHGSKHHRLQGSLGAGTSPGRVFPGKKMAGRLGNDKITIKNIKIINIVNNLLLVKGSIPGKIGNLISIAKQNK